MGVLQPVASWRLLLQGRALSAEALPVPKAMLTGHVLALMCKP